MIKYRNQTEQIYRPPSIFCHGFLDSNGFWNNGFACPIQNFIQYFCCGNDENRYCCPPDRYKFEKSSFTQSIDLSSSSSSSFSTENFPSSRQKTIERQFEQFQNYFLPIFLLSTTILFLIGIALWFWLYKHKVFYSIDRNESLPMEQMIDRTARSRSSTQV